MYKTIILTSTLIFSQVTMAAHSLSNEVQCLLTLESGNLDISIKVSDSEYNLILQDDVNTNGYTQWYFFRV